MSLLEIDGLVTEFGRGASAVRAVNGLDLRLEAGEIVALVGESGCGKSVTSLSVAGLLPPGKARIAAGEIRLDGQPIQGLSERRMRQLRGRRISMIFQEPMTALNPTMTIGDQVAEPLVVHAGMSWAQAREKVVEVLRRVNLPYPEQKMRDYPHQLSGGQRQRVVIALALIAAPDLVIADEPTTALDVTVQAQTLSVLRDINAAHGAAILLITHDFGVVAEIASRVVVMYAGSKVEEAPVAELFDHPAHPYTRALMASMPKLGSSREGEPARISGIPGIVKPVHPGDRGCAFSGRCAHASDLCRSTRPELRRQGAAGHLVACHHSEEVA